MKKYWPALVSGIMMGTTFIPFLPWAMLFCYVPLWIFLFKKSENLKSAFFAGWITQFVLSLIGFHWIYHVAAEFGHLPWFICLGGLLAFAALVHIYLALASLLGAYLRQKFSPSPFFFFVMMALLFSLSERIWPSIFPWHLGYTLLWIHAPAMQWADVIGFEGLSTFILLSQAVTAWLWVERKYWNTRRWKFSAGSFIAALILANVGGYFHALKWDETDRIFRPLIIQANIGNFEKVEAEKGRAFQYKVIDDHLLLMKSFMENQPEKWASVDAIIWPETAFPDFLDERYLALGRQAYLFQGMKGMQKPLLAGGYSREVRPPLVPLDYNALFLFDAFGKPLGPPYGKSKLLIFGEYLPLSEQFPVLLELFPFVASFGRGKGPTALALPRTLDASGASEELLIGAQICYEGLYPEFSRGLSQKNAHILVNVTNDSWFGQAFEPFQHMTMTLARAIEVRRPLVRSTNTGVSTVILANGKILEQSPLHIPWAGIFEVPYKFQPGTTFFVKYGHLDWIIWLGLLFVLIYASIKNTKGRSRANTNGIQNSRLDGNQTKD